MQTKKSSFLLWVAGNVFVALGVSICSNADLGVSMIAAPAFIVSEFLSRFSSFFSVGVTEYLIQGVLLCLMCLIIGRFRWRYLLGFLVAVIYGYTLDLFLWILSPVSFNSTLARWIGLIIGDCITALGVACFFRTKMPLQIYELFVAEMANRFSFNINKTKGGFDFSLLAVSIVLAFSLFGDAGSFEWNKILAQSFHAIGLGTLVTTAINSPIISLWGKILDRTKLT